MRCRSQGWKPKTAVVDAGRWFIAPFATDIVRWHKMSRRLDRI